MTMRHAEPGRTAAPPQDGVAGERNPSPGTRVAARAGWRSVAPGPGGPAGAAIGSPAPAAPGRPEPDAARARVRVPRAAPLTVDGLAQIVAKVLGLACSAGVLAIAARTFDARQFGIWAVATSLTTIVLGFDFGISNALRNRLVMGRMGRAGQDVAGAFQAAFLLLFGMAALFAALVSALTATVGWGWLFKDNDTARLGTAAVVVALLFLLARMPLGLGMTGFFSYREARLNALGESGVSLGLLVAVGLVAVLDLDLVPALCLYFGAMLAAVTAALAAFLRRRGWRLGPRGWREALAANWAWLRRDAPPFALLQFVAMFGSLSATFVVSGAVGLEEAGTFRAVLVIYLALLSLHLAYLMPVWSRCSEIVLSGTREEAVGLLRQTLARSTVVPACAVLFILPGPAAVSLWLGKPFDDGALVATLGLWAVLSTYHAALSVFLNGSGRPMGSFWAYLPGAVIFVPLGVVLGGRFGAVGVAATLAVTALIALVLMAWMVRALFAARFGALHPERS